MYIGKEQIAHNKLAAAPNSTKIFHRKLAAAPNSSRILFPELRKPKFPVQPRRNPKLRLDEKTIVNGT